MIKCNFLNRRDLIKAASFGLGVLVFPKLVIANSDDGFIDLRATKTVVQLAGAEQASSDLWLYNGSSPGPEIRVSQGETVRVRFTNELDEPTSIHWHGIRIDNAMDGVSGLTQEPVKSGETFEYVFEVPDAGTFWYHAHNRSWEQVARGLYGSLVVDEPTPLVERKHDLTLVLDDWLLSETGAIHLMSLRSLRDWSHAGRLGNWLTTNGVSQPTIELNKGKTYRLRLINTANARIMQFDPNALGAKVIAYDGFAFQEPREMNGETIYLTPAQRVDLLITAGEGENADFFHLHEVSGDEPVSIAEFEIVEGKNNILQKPNLHLHQNKTTKPDMFAAKNLTLAMEGGAMGGMTGIVHDGKVLEREDILRNGQMWAFNGVANLAKEPFFKVDAGQSMVITTDNQTSWSHGIHLHGHHFQIIERNGKTPQHIDWRDTFIIHRDESVKIAFVADNRGKWLLHCHMLEHAAAGMNTWFEVM